MKRKNFTIVELLVVISIIAILAGLLLPAISGVRNKAKKTKAKAQCNAIVLAIKNYESTYGLLPWTCGTDNVCYPAAPCGHTNDAIWYDWSGTDKNYYDTMLQILTKTGITGLAESTKGNARSIRFLDVPEGFTNTINDTTQPYTGSFRDPWGYRFGIAMDLNYDNQVTISGTVTQGTVFVWSFGPGTRGDGTNKDGTPNNSFGSNTSPADDVSSWHE